MTAYGFRLYVLRAYVGRKHVAADLSELIEAGPAGPALNELHSQLTGIRERLLFGAANYLTDRSRDEPDDQAGRSTHPYIRVMSVDRVGERIDVSVQYGREGDYEVLISQTGRTQSMTKRAAARTYRVSFMIPPHGTEAVMVAETHGRTQAGEALIQWLRVLNQQAAVTFDTNGDRSEAPFPRWDVKPMVDMNRIDGIFDGSSEHRITLKRDRIDAAGQHHSGSMQLTQNGLPVTSIDVVKQTVAKWWSEKASSINPRERGKVAARDLGTLVMESAVLDKLAFTDGSLTFLENGKTQTISPNTVERLFVYPLGTTKPSDPELLRNAVEHLRPMRTDLSIELDLTLSEEEQ